MGCGCELLMDTDDAALGIELLDIAFEEASRIEQKFSRYKTGNIVHRINTSKGKPITVDDETAKLLNFADRAHSLSAGLFDITSGILRKAWTFDKRDRLPLESDVSKLLPLVGWTKARWKPPTLQLLPGMEIDLGGIGKEYAVDRVVQLIRQKSNIGFLVNFGGDVAVGGKRRNNEPWAVGIENTETPNRAVNVIHIETGALATSGDSKKYVVADGKRHGHILDPRNGRPVVNPPHSVTVAAATCTEAGFFSTFGILNGSQADAVLQQAGVRHWCY